jgi:glycosyltransferase involved in cell wall biosynthesis
MNIAYFTICSRNYLAYALTLRKTLKESDPGAEFFIYLADDGEGTERAGDAAIIPVAEIAMPAIWDMALRYTVMEFNTAIKPFCILDLWDKRGFDAAVYVDPDIMVLRPMAAVEAALRDGADCVLTPHLLQPLDDDYHPDDIQILRTGVYNLGFGAFANRPGARRFVDWWAKKCETDCVVDLENGLFVDQRLADYAPAFCERAHILREPGYNVAYWNLKHREIAKTAEGWRAGGAPLVFFHFSGVVPGDPTVFSKHQNRLEVGDIGEARELLALYLSLLDANEHDHWRTIAYAFDRFSDGVRITPDMRRVYAKSHHAPLKSRERALRPRYELFNALAPVAHDGAKDFPVTRLMHEIYLGRKDLHDIFPLQTVEGRRGFSAWFLSSAPEEHGVPVACLGPTLRTMAKKDAAPALPAPVLRRFSFRKKIRPIVQAVYRGTPFVRDLYLGLPASVRMRLRKAVLNLDSEADLAAARAAPSISPSGGGFDIARRPGVDLYGYFRTESGVGEGARRAFAALDRAGIGVATFTIGTQGVFRESIDWPEDDPLSPPRRIALMHVNADQTPLLGRLIDPHRFDGAYRIGYWAWEIEQFPDIWASSFDLVEEIWTPSEFVADAIRRKTTKPVHVVPHPAVNGAVGAPDRKRFGIPEDALAVYANLDLNSYLERKNPFAAIRAFRTAFPDKADGAVLVLKAHGGKHVEAARRALKSAVGDAPNIILIDRVLSPGELADLHASADIYLSLHRAEGFGLGIAEFMALGKPVVVTGYSGNMQYTDETCARLVRYRLVEIGDGEYPHSAGARWADPDVEDAAAALKELALSPELRARLGAAAKARALRDLSAEAVGAIMRRRLEEIDKDLRNSLAPVRASSPGE